MGRGGGVTGEGKCPLKVMFLTPSVQDKINKKTTYMSFPSAGPPFRTSEMAMEVSPFEKWGLSLPPSKTN